MKEFEIKGRINTYDDLTHKEFLTILFDCLKKRGLHFIGETKIINPNENN
ncbi:hypothetical protein KDN24_06635 [Bacillus sp. Bva_UNVM-123]